MGCEAVLGWWKPAEGVVWTRSHQGEQVVGNSNGGSIEAAQQGQGRRDSGAEEQQAVDEGMEQMLPPGFEVLIGRGSGAAVEPAGPANGGFAADRDAMAVVPAAAAAAAEAGEEEASAAAGSGEGDELYGDLVDEQQLSIPQTDGPGDWERWDPGEGGGC